MFGLATAMAGFVLISPPGLRRNGADRLLLGAQVFGAALAFGLAIAGVTVMRSARPSEKAIARSLLSAAFVVGMLVFVGGKVASGVVDHMAR